MKYDIKIIGLMLLTILLLVGAIFGWCWQIVIPFYGLFTIPTMVYVGVQYARRRND